MAKETETKVTLVGKIVEVGDVQTFGKFSKIQVVVAVQEGKWEQFYPCTFGGKDMDAVDGFSAGDEVRVTGYLNGRKWVKKDANGKPCQAPRYFLEIAAKTCEVAGNDPARDADDTGEEEIDPESAQEEMPF